MDQEQNTEESQDQPQDMEQKQDESSEGVTEAEAEGNEAREKVEALEDDPPEKLEDWPDDAAKYETFGGPEGEHGYHEGPEQNLGPSALRHQEGGGVEIEGEEVDNPEEYKGDPIPGGPTDPNAPKVSGERDLSEGGGEDESDSDSDSDAEGGGEGGGS